jgi:hypothetical protein
MQKTICFLFLLAISVTVFSQDKPESSIKTPGRTSFFAEVGGLGILFSANIDTRFKKSSLGWGGRLGIGFVTADEFTIDNNGNYNWDMQSVVTIPAQVNYIFGKGESPHTFEVGAGITYVGKELEIFNFYDDKESKWFGTASFMYRRQPPKGGFSWRAGFTPLVAKGYIQPSGGVSVGWTF